MRSKSPRKSSRVAITLAVSVPPRHSSLRRGAGCGVEAWVRQPDRQVVGRAWRREPHAARAAFRAAQQGLRLPAGQAASQRRPPAVEAREEVGKGGVGEDGGHAGRHPLLGQLQEAAAGGLHVQQAWQWQGGGGGWRARVAWGGQGRGERAVGRSGHAERRLLWGDQPASAPSLQTSPRHASGRPREHPPTHPARPPQTAPPGPPQTAGSRRSSAGCC